MICGQCGTLNENEHQSCVRCKKPLHPAAMQGKIACAVHANREATTSCGSCGTRLCGECAVTASGVDFCEACAPETAERHHYDEDYERIPVLDPARAVRAGFGRRLLGLFFEPVILVALLGIFAIVWFPIKGYLPVYCSPKSGAGFWIFYALLAVAMVVYSSIMTSMNGQTWGKQIAGVIVLHPDGHVLNLKQAAARSCAAFLSLAFFGLGYLSVLWDPNKESWHDKIAGTAVYLWEHIS